MPEVSPLRAALHAAAGPVITLPPAFQGSEGHGGWQCQYTFAQQSAVFDGHFPQRPILPAVVQCLMAHCLIENALGHPMRLAAVVQAKFTRVVGPETVTLCVNPAPRPGLWDAALSVDGESAAKLRLLVEEIS